MTRVGAGVAVLAAAALCAVGLVRGTRAVGGSDSSCYALMADAFAAGTLQPTSPLAAAAPWPDARVAFAPAGFIPSRVRAEAASPICAPGFALLLAPFRWLGGRDGIFLATPLAGALLVWLTFVFTRTLAGAVAGAAASVIVATMPVLLFQIVQPMNDIAVTAVWMAVLAAAVAPAGRRAWLLGALTGVAILLRPNLAPSAAVVGLWCVVNSFRGESDAQRLAAEKGDCRNSGMPRDTVPNRRGTEVADGAQNRAGKLLMALTIEEWGRRSFRRGGYAAAARAALAFAVAASPFLLVLFALNSLLYGHPLQTGYGAPGDLFSVEHLAPNLQRYGRALFETQLGFPLLAVAAPLVVARALRAAVWLALGISVATLGVYLLYRPFDEWWYLRFLLPALVPMTALAVVVAARALGAPASRRGQRRTLRVLPATVLVIATVAIAAFGVRMARERQAFDLQRLEGRFRRTGDIVRDRLPENAVFITIWESGTVRFHAGRPALLWDALEPASLDPAVAWLTSRGLEPYIILERREEAPFRERFAAATPTGRLEWPPRFDIDRQVRIFRAADRDAYLKGAEVPTEYVLQR